MLSHATKNRCALLAACCLMLGSAPAVQAAQEHNPALSVNNGSGTECKVVFLEHQDCVEVAKHVRALFQTKDAPLKATWLERANAVLLRAAPEEVEQMAYLIAQIDVPVKTTEPPPLPQRLELIPIQHAKAKELSELVWRLLEPPSRRHRQQNATAAPPRMIADERTNALVLLATEDQVARAKALVQMLDKPVVPAIP